jgi:hypothetical protein
MNMCIYKLESIIYTKLIENDIGVEEDIFLIIFGLVKPVFVFCTSYFILRNHVGGIHVANPLLYILTTISITEYNGWASPSNTVK